MAEVKFASLFNEDESGLYNNIYIDDEGRFIKYFKEDMLEKFIACNNYEINALYHSGGFYFSPDGTVLYAYKLSDLRKVIDTLFFEVKEEYVIILDYFNNFKIYNSSNNKIISSPYEYGYMKYDWSEHSSDNKIVSINFNLVKQKTLVNSCYETVSFEEVSQDDPNIDIFGKMLIKYFSYNHEKLIDYKKYIPKTISYTEENARQCICIYNQYIKTILDTEKFMNKFE